MSGKYTKRGQSLLVSIDRLQDSFQIVNDNTINDLRKQVAVVKRMMVGIRNDFEREVKRLAKNQKNQDIVGRFGRVRKVKVAQMDAEIEKLSGSNTFGDIARRLNTIAARLD